MRLDSKDRAHGGCMLILGRVGSGKTNYIKQEISKICILSDDNVYIYAQNLLEYKSLYMQNKNIHFGEHNYYETILEEGRESLKKCEKQVHVYFDSCLSYLTYEELEEFFEFAGQAKTAGVHLTVTMQDLDCIPEELHLQFLELFDHYRVFDIDLVTKKIVDNYIVKKLQVQMNEPIIKQRQKDFVNLECLKKEWQNSDDFKDETEDAAKNEIKQLKRNYEKRSRTIMENSKKMDYKSRRYSGSGGHLLFVGFSEEDINRQVNIEMNQIKAETDDMICVFTKKEQKYRFYDVHVGEIKNNNYDFLLEEGRKLIERKKRLWVFFDFYLDFNTNTIEDFLEFAAKARSCGVIITMATEKLNIPREMLGNFLSMFDGINTTNSIIKELIVEEKSKKKDEGVIVKEEVDHLKRYIQLKEEVEEMERQTRKYKVIIGSVAVCLCGTAILVWKNRRGK